MLRVQISQARPGMRLAFPVFRRNQPEMVLLRAGFELDQTTIDRLFDMKIGAIWIAYPGLEFISRYISPEVSHRRVQLMRLLGDATERLKRESGPYLDFAPFRHSLRSLIQTLRYDRTAALLVNTLQEAEGPLQRHSSEVCYLSLLIGIALDAYLVRQRQRLTSARAKDVLNLGLGGLFHDIGVTRMSDDVQRSWLNGRDENDPSWHDHVHLGYELVRKGLAPSAAVAILHHHQRYDGSGFPHEHDLAGGLRGEDIHVYARIVAAADVFDRIRYADVDQPLPTVTALKRIQSPDISGMLDPIIVEGLLLVVPAYPPGSLVRLSSGDRAVVTHWRPEEPCRPGVQLLAESLDAGIEDLPRIELIDRPDLVITHVDDRLVKSDNFYATRARQYGLLPDGTPDFRNESGQAA